jgi:hypothetical protein
MTKRAFQYLRTTCSGMGRLMKGNGLTCILRMKCMRLTKTLINISFTTGST